MRPQKDPATGKPTPRTTEGTINIMLDLDPVIELLIVKRLESCWQLVKIINFPVIKPVFVHFIITKQPKVL